MAMETLRLEPFKSGSHYLYKMWLGAFCVMVLGDLPLGACIRNSIHDTTSMPPKVLSDPDINQSAADVCLPAPPAQAVKTQLSLSTPSTGSSNEEVFHQLPAMGNRSMLYDGEFRCQRQDVKISCDVTRYGIDGVPTYRIQIANTCMDCSFADIHIACGDWASATLVNPNVFRRLGENDCVVNNGSALVSQDIVCFEYSNSFPYPMFVRNASPVCT